MRICMCMKEIPTIVYGHSIKQNLQDFKYT